MIYIAKQQDHGDGSSAVWEISMRQTDSVNVMTLGHVPVDRSARR